MSILILLLSIAIFTGMVYASVRLANLYHPYPDFTDYIGFFSILVLVIVISAIMIFGIYHLIESIL